MYVQHRLDLTALSSCLPTEDTATLTLVLIRAKLPLNLKWPTPHQDRGNEHPRRRVKFRASNLGFIVLFRNQGVGRQFTA